MLKRQLLLIEDLEKNATVAGGEAVEMLAILRTLIAAGCSDGELRLMTRSRFSSDVLRALRAERLELERAVDKQLAS